MGLPARYAVNVRMLKDYDATKLKVTPNDGMLKVGPPYKVE